MKTNSSLALAAVTLGLIALVPAIRAENTMVDAPTSPAAPVSTSSPNVPSNLWTDIKDYTYDQRAKFFPGLELMQNKVDAQVAELTARRAAMNSTVNTKDWDFAMKEMVDARAYLKSTGEVLEKATPETWQQEKEKVGQAWVRTQEAYAKVKSSTTS